MGLSESWGLKVTVKPIDALIGKKIMAEINNIAANLQMKKEIDGHDLSEQETAFLTSVNDGVVLKETIVPRPISCRVVIFNSAGTTTAPLRKWQM